MNQARQTDKWICCAGVLFMSAIAVFGYLHGNREIAIFGAGGFTAFSGPLFMAMNREIGAANGKNGNGNGNGNGSVPDPTTPQGAKLP